MLNAEGPNRAGKKYPPLLYAAYGASSNTWNVSALLRYLMGLKQCSQSF